ncbi:MAG: cryptochrome/photolyase family protein, partial [Nannocystaceae bacterium]
SRLRVALVEDSLFFGDRHHPARFHRQKLWFHRATMKRYAKTLEDRGHEVAYVEHREDREPLCQLLQDLASEGVAGVVIADPHDDLLGRRLARWCEELSLRLRVTATPMFLNSTAENRQYRAGKRRWFMADFYKVQRRRLGVLLDGDEPVGGKWSLDGENRKKVPRKLLNEIPTLRHATHDTLDHEARTHVEARYSENPGALEPLIYPTSHEASTRWLEAFLEERFERFGDYEDAIVEGENTLWHSVLTPMLNVGLLTPRQVLDAALEAGERRGIPLNALEGFVRQVIGWREFMRATYEDLGVAMRTTNHWAHHRPMSPRFYDATTGIDPVDDVIRRVLSTGYCHHIERLMVLGGFMFLCEIDPDDVYRWFMELFVDSYDWVMVPNVYAMSQHADGGLITTKPYFSGSAYIKKMSNFRPGPWTEVWDGLYWRWIFKHVDALAKNPRWSMMCAMARKMDPQTRDTHLERADAFLATI